MLRKRLEAYMHQTPQLFVVVEGLFFTYVNVIKRVQLDVAQVALLVASPI